MKNISKIPALDVSHLTVSYVNPILMDFSVCVPQGVMCGIIGPNGAGKTTFIKAVLGLISVTAGTVTILGQTIVDVRNKIAYIPQRSSVDWDFPLTVFDMVLMGCYGRLGWFKHPTPADYVKVYESLNAVDLCAYAHKSISVLSGGQQQRAFLARALMQDAQIYFLDEPFAGVDIATEQIIINLFKQLRDEGKTVIVVHHDLFTASSYFDWAILLNKTCVMSGPVEQVLTPMYLEKTYGTNFRIPFDTFLKTKTLPPTLKLRRTRQGDRKKRISLPRSS